KSSRNLPCIRFHRGYVRSLSLPMHVSTIRHRSFVSSTSAWMLSTMRRVASTNGSIHETAFIASAVACGNRCGPSDAVVNSTTCVIRTSPIFHVSMCRPRRRDRHSIANAHPVIKDRRTSRGTDMKYGDVEVTRNGHVAIVEIQRGPNNFFDVALINSLGDAFATLDADGDCRASLLSAQRK